VVLVTGGAKGIGRMIAEGFVANGAKVYLSGRDAAACRAAAAELNKDHNGKGGSAHALPANLQHMAECQRLATELARLEPAGLHVLVNNAGATWGADLDAYPDDAWTKVLTLNLQRVFSLTQLLLPQLEKAAAASSSEDGGSAAKGIKVASPSAVIHIGSIDGLRVPALENYAYAASKAGLHHLSRALARAVGPRGITSNVLACGPFPTKMMRAVLESEMGDVLNAEVPVGRIGRPADVAGACLFLASKAGAFCNGATIRLDGGASLVSKI
jgi:NAD(P)-dependent dehydrogenase (short-subunit alcohol dehydrogenase family)